MYSEISSSAVRKRLSSTRRLLEQTLNSKHRTLNYTAEPFKEPLETTHNQLKKPNFEHFGQIFKNYTKAPISQKTECKTSTTQRSSTTTPPVYQKSKDQLIKDYQEKFSQECTFKPSISKIPQDKSLNYTERAFNREEWFKNLTKPKSEVAEQREKMKWAQEQESNRECSFQPKITNFRSINTSSLTIEERLYNHEKNKQQNREQIKREKEEKEANSYPYSPQISKSVGVLMDNRKTQVPLYKRLDELQHEKKTLRQLEKEKSEKHQNLTFRPSISENSKRLADSKCQGDLISRLSYDASKSKDCINEISLGFSSTTSKPFNTKEFLNRQHDYYIKSKNHKKEVENKNSEELSFKPRINLNSNFIANYKHKYAQETMDDKICRISSQAALKKQNMKKQINNDYYEKYTFEPKINNISKQLAKSTNMIDYQEELKNKRKIQAQASVAELQRICSFSPQINSLKKKSLMHTRKSLQNTHEKQDFDKNGEYGESKYKQGENVLENIEKARKNKEKVLFDLKQERDFKDFSNCTFQPKKTERLISENNVQVKGIERFYELRSIAKQQKIEKKLSEKTKLYHGITRDLVYAPRELC
ncbi:hypothetical protein SteCoe_21478 [Stentor coeruleus]|uniref:Uncharacterized protein n=1 Tax=Stentor coeruleus TaxID=5963 RepID=A0A1R2BPI1_9CILI|nr:hypothetical protein SteCoe_21478 [Stentor coeruleus]